MRPLGTLLLLLTTALSAPGATVSATAEAAAPDAGWEPAHWELRDGIHVWVDGHTVPRPATPPPNAVWVAGHWTWTVDGWLWERGHYRASDGDDRPVPVEPAQDDEVVVVERPPPVRVEVVPACPGPEYCWSGGYWSWQVHTWVWVPGCWRLAPVHGVRWYTPRWTEVHGSRSGYRFVPGGWRR